MTEAEKKGKEFLDFVATNDKKLRKNLKKNITFDPNLFDDIYQDTIVKVYNSIVKNNKQIDDFEQYFFISSKFNYILKQKSERERVKKRIDIDDYVRMNDIECENYCESDLLTLIEDVRDIIEDRFGEENTELYLDYMKLKIDGGMSYTKYSQITGVPVSKISDVVSKIKQFTKTDTNIRRIFDGVYL